MELKMNSWSRHSRAGGVVCKKITGNSSCLHNLPPLLINLTWFLLHPSTHAKQSWRNKSSRLGRGGQKGMIWRVGSHGVQLCLNSTLSQEESKAGRWGLTLHTASPRACDRPTPRTWEWTGEHRTCILEAWSGNQAEEHRSRKGKNGASPFRSDRSRTKWKA